MEKFAFGTLVGSVGLLIYGVWVMSVYFVVAGALALVIGVLAATVADLAQRGDDK